MRGMDDIRGVERQTAAGEAGYAAFVEVAWAGTCGVARLLTGDPHRAEELLQDCLVKLHPQWRRVTLLARQQHQGAAQHLGSTAWLPAKSRPEPRYGSCHRSRNEDHAPVTPPST